MPPFGARKASCPRNHPEPVTRNAKGVCVECNRERAREWRARNPERDRANAKRWAANNPEKSMDLQLRKYGIDRAEYLSMLSRQGGVCAICRRQQRGDRRLAVDHDHTTGEVRGLLCSNCNTALGLLKDDPQIVTGLALYVHRHVLSEAV